MSGSPSWASGLLPFPDEGRGDASSLTAPVSPPFGHQGGLASRSRCMSGASLVSADATEHLWVLLGRLGRRSAHGDAQDGGVIWQARVAVDCAGRGTAAFPDALWRQPGDILSAA
ncbi:hypothetical protein TESG_05473 [Trichophyton tonsurans CBS 112818]|uniref:Uncharacterized protein n=1 Tax=Trichophyton tonsurans (strain CBS 112818) TaxID=647933 RepID=F2S3D4_TRIT1|nr:hypothetical protein TESG_05473 [Trichophyton tonsurans CBS 112818]